MCLIFHFLFRIGAICTYFFGTWFTDNFVLIFVLCVLLLVFDFWTVKNVSGRLLVGLRWWSENKEDGSTTWLFESRDVRLLYGFLYVVLHCGCFVKENIWDRYGAGMLSDQPAPFFMQDRNCCQSFSLTNTLHAIPKK